MANGPGSIARSLTTKRDIDHDATARPSRRGTPASRPMRVAIPRATPVDPAQQNNWHCHVCKPFVSVHFPPIAFRLMQRATAIVIRLVAIAAQGTLAMTHYDRQAHTNFLDTIASVIRSPRAAGLVAGHGAQLEHSFGTDAAHPPPNSVPARHSRRLRSNPAEAPGPPLRCGPSDASVDARGQARTPAVE